MNHPRKILLLAILFVLAAVSRVFASGVAALGDVSCGVFTNTATVGIPCVTNAWLDGVLGRPSLPHCPWWFDPDGLILPNTPPSDDAALTMGQLKWGACCACRVLDEAAGVAGGAGSACWSEFHALDGRSNDEAVSTDDFCAVMDTIDRRVYELAVDGMSYSVSAPPPDSVLPGAGTNLVAVRHLKIALTFDPFLDFDADGLPDWWERTFGGDGWSGGSADLDPSDDLDLDGLRNADEWLLGTDPTDRDTDGDGMVDGVDPDPAQWNDPTDGNGNGLPDAFETFWFGAPDATLFPSAPVGDGFTLGVRMAAGICPTNPVPQTDWPTNGMSALRLVPRFGVEAVDVGAVVWERTFELERHGAWEQYFISSEPNPLAVRSYGRNGGWALDGLVLEWADSAGASGSASLTAGDAPLRAPVSASAGNGPLLLTLRLRTTRSGLVSSPQPLFLLSYTPSVSFPDLPTVQSGDARLSAVSAGTEVLFSIDRSLRPSSEPLGAEERTALPFDEFGWTVLGTTTGYEGEVTDGTLSGLNAGFFDIPFVSPPPPSGPPSLRFIPPEIRRVLLAVLDPRLTYGTGHGPDASGLAWDPESGTYARTFDFPLDTEALWSSFHSDSNGLFVCGCTPELRLGVPDRYAPCFMTNIVVSGAAGRETAEATVGLGGEEVWTGTADHLRFTLQSESPSEEDACGCETCEELNGPKLGSLGFRLVLGEPRAGQVSGFVWFHSEGPVAVAPETFSVLARADAAVSDTTAGGVRTVACSDGRGRTVAVAPIENGVSISVTYTATGGPDHSWTVVNENGDPSRVRFVRTSRAGNIQSDRTFAFSGGVWTVLDPVAGTSETLLRADAFGDAGSPTGAVERILTDASGLALVHDVAVSRRYGSGPAAVLREVERREAAGTPFEKTLLATYWEDGGARAGLPRLRSGNARAWSWTDYDAAGRPVLVFEQRDGSPCPEDGTDWTLDARPSMTAFATSFSYAPLAGDSNNPEDDAVPRTESRYVLDGATKALIGRTWTVVSRGASDGLPTVSVRTERAASQGAAFGDPSNAVSIAVSVAPDAPGVPLLLRGRPLSVTGEDGVTTSFEYAFGSWDPAAHAFADASGASHLRVRSRTTTPEAPSGIPLVSTVSETVEDAAHGNEVWSATRVLLADGSLSEPFDWEARVYDEQDRLRSTLFADGSSSTNAYSCCRLLFTVGRDGLRRERLADTGTDHLRRAWLDVSFADLPKNQSYDYLVPQTYDYSKAVDFRAVKSTFDPVGRETVRRTMATRPRLATSIGSLRPAPGSSAAEYWWDVAETNLYPHGTSDQRIHVDARGLRTVTSVYRYPFEDETWTETYDGTNLLERTVSCTVRGGSSESYRAWDGGWTDTRSLSLHGADGRRTDLSVTESSDGPAVTNSLSVSDLLGRTVRVATPLSDATYAYDGASSRVLSVSDARSGLSTTTLYDALRQPVGSLGSDGVASLSSIRFERDASNALWRVTETREAAGGATNRLSTVRERLTGLSDALRSETVFLPAGGAVSRTTVSFDPATFVSVETNLVDGLAPLVRRSKFGRVFETRERDGTVRSSFFDPYGRPYLEGETPPGGSFVWRTWTYRDALGDPVGTIELAPASLAASGLATNCWSSLWGSGVWKGLLTERAFDRRGNLAVSWDPAGNATYHERDSIGRLVGSFGATYPVSRTLDTAGRLVALGTARDGSAWDVTAWAYDRATGLCTNKTYADGSRVVRSFTPDGLTLRTDFASGRWTQNAYDAARRLSSVTTSDGEGDTDYVRDAFGRIVQATDPTGRTVLSLDPLGRPASETRLSGRGYSMVLSCLERPRDALGRPAGLRLEFEGDFRQSVCYTWGMDGRLSGMILSNAQDRAVEVFFDWDRGRLAGWEAEGLGSCLAEFRQRFERYDRRPALVKTAVAGPPGRIPPPSTRSFSYVRDLFGRPVSRNADAFAHDALGQVTNAVLGGASYRYAYDGIGNRTTATEAGAQTDYFANALNQYTNLVAGSPPSGTALTYDPDGNLTDDGARTFEWTASGRLLRAATDSARVTSEYDHLGRRTARTVETRHVRWWNFADEREFVYDDWNLVHEKRILHATGQIVRLDYFWGPDLSGTLQGAGGVGGLVAVSVGGDYYFPGYDDNGNVIGYWDEAGDLVAEYVYDAFGNTISATGPMADVFPHRFSTKYYDAETDLYYYGYRYYSPSLGRWISRDPIEEEGGMNLYAFVANTPTHVFDVLGERLGEWPDPNKTSGWAFLGEMNFPGRGWSGPFRTRPVTMFDLAAKIHDLHYEINAISFSYNNLIPWNHHNFLPWNWGDHNTDPEISRKAKADYIFKKMNDLYWEGDVWSRTLNFLSHQVFFDDPKFFCKGDGFVSFLNDFDSPDLGDPTKYLMIPYSQLSAPPVKEETFIHSRGIGPTNGKTISPRRTIRERLSRKVPDYLAIAPEDIHPGFFRWGEQMYGETWFKIKEITDETDFTFTW